MNPKELAGLLGAETVVEGDLSRKIQGGYCGDFLSFVMGRAPAGAAWFTVMSNVNVAAVAYMADVGAVVLCESVQAEPALIERCNKEEISLLQTQLDVYNAAAKLVLYENKV